MLLSGKLLLRCRLLDCVHLLNLRFVFLYLLLLVSACFLNLHDLLDLLLILVCHKLHFYIIFFQLVLVMGVQVVHVRNLVILLLYRQRLLGIHRLELGKLVDRLLLIVYLLVQLGLELLMLRFSLLQLFAFRDPDLLIFNQLLEPLVH